MENTGLTYNDLAEAAGLLAERLYKSEQAVLDLNQRLAAAQGEVAALRGILEYERERAQEFRHRDDFRPIAAAGVLSRGIFAKFVSGLSAASPARLDLSMRPHGS
jgi:hypothetical protein